jgi:hypothetical protein
MTASLHNILKRRNPSLLFKYLKLCTLNSKSQSSSWCIILVEMSSKMLLMLIHRHMRMSLFWDVTQLMAGTCSATKTTNIRCLTSQKSPSPQLYCGKPVISHSNMGFRGQSLGCKNVVYLLVHPYRPYEIITFTYCCAGALQNFSF